MKKTLVLGKPLPAMTLGTVQLGMNYGIANQDGKPNEEKSFAILRTAIENGAASLDTARAYGDSEDVIGRFLKTLNGDLHNHKDPRRKRSDVRHRKTRRLLHGRVPETPRDQKSRLRTYPQSVGSV